MGKSKKKNSKRVKYVALDGESDQQTCHKRSEVETTNYKSNQKNINKNQIVDKSECKESFSEGIHINDTNNKTENSKLDSYEIRECTTNMDSFDQPRKELINEKEKQVPKESDSSEFIDKVIVEIDQDLFKLSHEISLACCADEDFKMESDIGAQFKRIFGDDDKLLEQNLKMGTVGLVNRHNQNAFYLVIKKCDKKSKMRIIIQAFKNLLSKMKEMNLTSLAIAKTDFESEGHNWLDLKNRVTEVFAGSGIHITVCVPPKELECQQSKDSFNNVKKTHHELKVTGPVNESSDQTYTDCNMACDTRSNKKKKKEKKNKDQLADNFDSNKSKEYSHKKKSSSSLCHTSFKHEHSQSTDDTDTSQELKNKRYSKKSLNNKKSIKNKIDFLDDVCSVNLEGDKCSLKEIDLNLFDLPVEYALAHCVAEDLRMGAGIAVEFKQRFASVGKLIDQKLKVGNVGLVQRHDQNVFYLITKKYSTGKPTMRTMEMALRSLVSLMKSMKLTKLGIPKIGCGLDGLDWDNVKLLIMQMFSGSDINIVACIPSKFLDCPAPKPLEVYITPMNLWEMELQTIIIMPIDLHQVYNNTISNNVIDQVNSRYPFKENLLEDIKKMDLYPGAIKNYCVNDEYLFCVFFDQDVYYSSLEIAFKEILHSSKKYMYLAIQSGSVFDNFKHISWIVLILRSIGNNQQAQLWLCGDSKQTDDVMMYDQYCKNVRYSMDRSTSRVIYKSNKIPQNRSAEGGYSSRNSLSWSTYSNNSIETDVIPSEDIQTPHSYSAQRYSQNYRSSPQWQTLSNNCTETNLMSSKEKQTPHSYGAQRYSQNFRSSQQWQTLSNNSNETDLFSSKEKQNN